MKQYVTMVAISDDTGSPVMTVSHASLTPQQMVEVLSAVINTFVSDGLDPSKVPKADVAFDAFLRRYETAPPVVLEGNSG